MPENLDLNPPKVFCWGNTHSPFIREQIETVENAGYEVHWYWHTASKLSFDKAYSLPGWVSKQVLFRVFLEPFFVLFLLYTIKPDIVHLFYAMKGIAPFFFPTRAKILVSVMGSDIETAGGYKGVLKHFTRNVLTRADYIITKSIYMNQRVCEIDVDFRDKLKQIVWGVDIEEFKPDIDVVTLRKSLSIPNAGLIFFDPRSARPFYKKDEIIRAFARYVKKSGNFQDRLLISEFLGTEKYLMALREIVIEEEIQGQVYFVGAIPYEKISAYYALSDVIISFAPSDGVPQTLLEAMACGAFLITSDLPQYDGIVEDGVTGKRVIPDDVDMLTATINWVYENPEIRDAATLHGRAYVEEHANKQLEAQKLLNLYADLLKDNKI